MAAEIAKRYLGTPYVWGGAGPGGFDCSGLVAYVYGRLGVHLPHNAAAQYHIGRTVRGKLHPGDRVYFHGLGHTGIYVGHGKMIDSPHSGAVVRYAAVHRSDYIGAKRF